MPIESMPAHSDNREKAPENPKEEIRYYEVQDTVVIATKWVTSQRYPEMGEILSEIHAFNRTTNQWVQIDKKDPRYEEWGFLVEMGHCSPLTKEQITSAYKFPTVD